MKTKNEIRQEELEDKFAKSFFKGLGARIRQDLFQIFAGQGAYGNEMEKQKLESR